MLALSSQADIVAALRQQLHRWEGSDKPTFPSGLEGILPDGFHRGTLVEYLADCGSGATALALIAAGEACREGQALVVIDRERRFYPLAGAMNSILIRPQTQKDELWAMNQSLDCQGVGAVLCWPSKLDDRAFRSLQLAAERGGSVGLMVRPVSVRSQPSWSDVQLLVESLPGGRTRRLRIEIVRCRKGSTGAREVELDDESRTLHLAPELAASAPPRFSSGA
jgi:protein ImuA